MPIYRFRMLGRFDRVVAGQYQHCEDDDAAREHANVLASRTGNSNIEIWSDQRQVARECHGPLPDAPRPPSGDRRRQRRHRAA
jgi:hypothetical protein